MFVAINRPSAGAARHGASSTAAPSSLSTFLGTVMQARVFKSHGHSPERAFLDTAAGGVIMGRHWTGSPGFSLRGTYAAL